MWKIEDFFVTQILREINFRESRSSKIAIFAISEAQNVLLLELLESPKIDIT